MSTNDEKYAILKECWAIEEELIKVEEAIQGVRTRVVSSMRAILRTVEYPPEVRGLMDALLGGQLFGTTLPLAAVATLREKGVKNYLLILERSRCNSIETDKIYKQFKAKDCTDVMQQLKDNYPELDPKTHNYISIICCSVMDKWM